MIFISSTSDLRSARDLVGKILYSMGYEPVWQEIASTDGGELLEVLRRRLAPCAMVLQLVGRRYGAEPPHPTLEFGRVSYTQFEALEAERVGKRVIYHFLDDNFPTDPATAETPEREALQTAYRQQLKDTNHLRYGGISNSSDLELSIRRISDDLAKLRLQAEQRQRRIVTLAIALALGISAVAAMVVVMMRRQVETSKKIDDTNTQVKDELAALRQQVSAAVSPKQLSAGQSQPEPISPEILSKARVLLDRGGDEDQALGKIALNQHAEADQIIQRLKSRPDNPVDEAFRLLTMEGDNWYRAGEPDRAIPAYEQAVALKPEDARARSNLAIALIDARRGDITAIQQHAIEVMQGSLKLLPQDSTDWAGTQINIAIAWSRIPTGDKSQHLRNALAAYKAASTVFTKKAYPRDWAMVQLNVGTAFHEFPGGDKATNLQKARAAYEASQEICTREAYPQSWAKAECNIGATWADVSSGDPKQNLQRAIDAYQSALTVYTKAKYPVDRARILVNLGESWSRLSTGNKSDNVKRAIAITQEALTVYTSEEFPADFAWAQRALGMCWRRLPENENSKKLDNAMAAFDASLAIYTKDAFPLEWARTQHEIGTTWSSSTSGDKVERLQKSVAAYERALTVYAFDTTPGAWANTQAMLASANLRLGIAGNAEAFERARDAYESALRVYNKAQFPSDWVEMQIGLANLWEQYPSGDHIENLKKAAAGYRAALSVNLEEFASRRPSWETSLTWFLLLTKDFSGALDEAQRGAPSQEVDLFLKTNEAHALLFLGRTKEAEAIYFQYIGQYPEGSKKTWEGLLLDDFDELEKSGLTHPEFSKIRERLKARAQSPSIKRTG